MQRITLSNIHFSFVVLRRSDELSFISRKRCALQRNVTQGIDTVVTEETDTTVTEETDTKVNCHTGNWHKIGN